MLVRKQSATDRRVVKLRITESGANAVALMQLRLAALWQDQAIAFSPDELATLTELLRRLKDGLEAD